MERLLETEGDTEYKCFRNDWSEWIGNTIRKEVETERIMDLSRCNICILFEFLYSVYGSLSLSTTGKSFPKNKETISQTATILAHKYAVIEH